MAFTEKFVPSWFRDLTGYDKHDFKGSFRITVTVSGKRKSFVVEFSPELRKKDFDLVDTIKRELDILDADFDRARLTADIDLIEVEATPPFDLTLEMFPKFFSELINLKTLSLRFHKLTKMGDEQMASLMNLTSLNLRSNSIDSLPESIGLLENLVQLDLSENNLSSLPATLSRLTNLKTLNLQSNKLEKWLSSGSLPQRKLAILNIGSNGITELPAHLFQLTSITQLILSQNKISKLSSDITALQGLRYLDVRANSLKELPNELSSLRKLDYLDVSDNKLSPFLNIVLQVTSLTTLRIAGINLTDIPPAIVSLTALQCLDLARNNLSKVAAELFELTNLTELDVSFNNLKTMPSGLGQLKLFKLNFDGNVKLKLLPRNFLQLVNLQELTVAGVTVIRGEKGELKVQKVNNEISSPKISPAKQLRQLVFLARSTPHPMLVYALAVKSLDGGCLTQVLDEGGLEELITFCKSDNPMYCKAALAAVRSISDNPSIRSQIAIHEKSVIPTMRSLLKSEQESVKCAAIDTIGNLALDEATRKLILSDSSFVEELLTMANTSHNTTIFEHIRRTLAILGAGAKISNIALSKRGIRILAIDGGGSRGAATAQMLMNIEKRVGKQLHEVFDMIVGTSVGSVIATMSVVKKMAAVDIQSFIRSMCTKIFAIPGGSTDGDKVSTWATATHWGKLLGLSSAIRTGTFYMTKPYEELVKSICGEPRVIDTAAQTNVKLVITATRLGVVPPEVFVFRNYNLPANSSCPWKGDCEAPLWQAIRASSAAPSYFEEVMYKGDKLVDGGLVCNNPTAVAITEAKLLWPDRPLDLVVSVGTGKPYNKVDKPGAPALVSLANALIESATDPEKTHLALAPVLPPDVYIRLQPVDEAFNYDLDETRPERLDAMQLAAQAYIDKNSAYIDRIAAILSQE